MFFEETADVPVRHESGSTMAAAAATAISGIEEPDSAMAAAAATAVSDATGSASSSWKPTLRPKRVIAFEAD